MSETPASRVSARWVLVLAIAVVVVLPQIPIVSLVLAPLGWLGTLTHETGHALGAIAVGGQAHSVQVFLDGSGVAHSSYPRGTSLQAAVSIAGLVGPAVTSMLLLWSGWAPRLAKVSVVFLGLALWIEAATLTQGFATAIAFGWGTVALLAAWRLSAHVVRLGILVIAVQLALHVYRTSSYLFTAEAHTGAGTMPSDVANVASVLGGHHLMWGVGIGGLDLLLLSLGLLGFFFGDRFTSRRS